MLKKSFIYLTVILSVISVLAATLSVSAENEHPNGVITVNTRTIANGDTGFTTIKLSDNPGIMAMTISITYDSSALKLVDYFYGIIKDNMVVDHPDKNLIRYVSCEKKDNFENGTFLFLQFKVKEDAEFGFYPITVDYKSGDFCNWKLEKIMPEIVPGGVEVKYNGENCKHSSYTDWEVAAGPTCKAEGAKQRFCKKCGHSETAKIPVGDHYFENKWYIDKEATPEEDGIMSRHCRYCDVTTDVLTFTYKQSKDEKLEENKGGIIAPSDFTDKLVKEQLPEVYDKNGGSSIPPKNTDPAVTLPETPKQDSISEIGNVIQKNTDSRLGKIMEFIPNFKSIARIIAAVFIILYIL